MSIPDFCLVMVFAGQSPARSEHLLPTGEPGEFIDVFSTAVGADQGANPVVSEPALEKIADAVAARLQARKLTVVDGGALSKQQRAVLIQTAKRHFAATIAVIVEGRTTGSSQSGQQPFRRLSGEGLADVIRVADDVELAAALANRAPLSCDRRTERGPFDIIGDVHGCRDELIELLAELGYRVGFKGKGAKRRAVVDADHDRRVIFVGDLVDRGPASPDVVRLVMAMVAAGQAFCVLGNHDARYMRYLQGRDIRLTHGLAATVSQFARESEAMRDGVKDFLEALPYQLWLDDGRLVVAHAGIREDMIGRETGAVREFCLFGDRSGGKDAMGLPVRYHWALDYHGPQAILYGHTPIPAADWVNNTLCLDTGCVFGGHLSALRWPEREIAFVPAKKAYVQRSRPFGHPPPRPKPDAAPNP